MSYALICGKPLIKKIHSTYQTELFGNEGLGVHFYKKILSLMEPSNCSKMYNSPTSKGYLSPLYKEQLFADGSFKAMFKRFRVLEYKQFFKCPNKVSKLNTNQNLCIPKDNK
jgi:hypothetical protein